DLGSVRRQPGSMAQCPRNRRLKRLLRGTRAPRRPQEVLAWGRRDGQIRHIPELHPEQIVLRNGGGELATLLAVPPPGVPVGWEMMHRYPTTRWTVLKIEGSHAVPPLPAAEHRAHQPTRSPSRMTRWRAVDTRMWRNSLSATRSSGPNRRMMAPPSANQYAT